ncbi:DUF1015 domain-containing protein [Clostridium lacusfryxellense]|uniref:DUF1015 domain-containing protein n=1 Tax=Clostridium lacusfryxellense TaxID=205328 RepID=UPI001C0ABA4E|nr:DUF1015 family protein [Clostridium lacusfryxellense]MBU3114687.1 DUF1015 family protein [Clostridium lacusfryxellense]
MAVVRPFRSYRPQLDLVEKVAALPYDVMDSKEARDMVKGKPYSFLHVDKPEVDLYEDIDIHDQQVYLKARENLQRMIKDKVYVQDEKPCMYIYRQIMNGRPQTGIVACTSIDDYINDVIKKHEHTRADKELDRFNHIDYTNSNTGPIFLTYRHKDEIDDIVKNWTGTKTPVYDFKSGDEVSQIIWVIDDEVIINKLSTIFAKTDYLYIADGHHRSASAVKVGLKRRQDNPSFNGNEEFNFFLSVIFPDNDLYIMDYNRVVADLFGNTNEEFLKKVSEKFDVTQCSEEGQFKPNVQRTYGMFLDGKWYKLAAKEGTFNMSDPVERLDVSILQKNLLEPILGIDDPRTNSRIDFIGGIRGLGELERRVGGGMRVAFSMCPTTMDDLMDIANSGKVMPPKSTWFEPKLQSGIFVHEL